MNDPSLDSTRNLAKWLQEAGQRRPGRAAPGGSAAPEAPAEPPSGGSRLANEFNRTRWLVLTAVGAIAYLQYFYADTFLEISSLPAVLVFLLVNGQLPPV